MVVGGGGLWLVVVVCGWSVVGWSVVGGGGLWLVCGVGGWWSVVVVCGWSWWSVVGLWLVVARVHRSRVSRRMRDALYC